MTLTKMTPEEARLKILEVLNTICPSGTDEYSTSFIKDVVNHFVKLHELQTKRNAVISISYSESIRVEILQDVANQMRKDLLEDGESFLWQHDEYKNEYERGVLNAIRLIQFRVHCIMDD